MNRKNRKKRILRRLKRCGWSVECCYRCDVFEYRTGEGLIRAWHMDPDSPSECHKDVLGLNSRLPPFKHAEKSLVFVLLHSDGRRRVLSGWRNLSWFAQNEWKWRLIVHMEEEIKCHSTN